MSVRCIRIKCRDSPTNLRIILGTSIVPNFNIVLRLNDRPMVRNKDRHFPAMNIGTPRGTWRVVLNTHSPLYLTKKAFYSLEQ
jgi:hypothetical protein